MQQHGFILQQEAELAELHSRARLWLHEKSGARLLSISNTDENKVFGVSFRTPPADSTGLPHILEHSVLCGSDKYPVKEPFVELLKGSLQTFLNAFTYPDKTCYPVASANLKDFYNLIDVYLDAVFYPRISEDIFQQEGWHLEAESPDAPLTYKGVVYNEMKGVFSSPEAVLSRQSLHALFPDSVYGLESGGDPQDIPTLTYQAFKDFHTRYYHPDNARFFFWGDDPEEQRLALLDVALKNFTKPAQGAAANSSVTPQAPFSTPKSFSLPFAAGEEEEAMFTLNWVLPASKPQSGEPAVEAAVRHTLALRMLEHILLGLPASPLRRALIESGLGEDLTGDGLEAELRQLIFSIGLKGIAAEDAPEAQELILHTLRALATPENLEPYLEAAINSVEFALRENNTGRFPVGLAIMLQALTTWLHEDAPGAEGGLAALAPLRYEKSLAAIKQGGTAYFANLITSCFLDNPHRAAVLLLPDRDLANRRTEEERAALKAIEVALTPEQKQALEQNTKRLKAWQEAPDAPDALATIPRLTLEDLPRQNRLIAQEKPLLPALPPSSEANAVFFHPQPTNGIVYVDITLAIDAVPDRLLPLLPLLGRAMLEMGTRERDFVSLNMDIARKTGGMDSGLLLLNRYGKTPGTFISRFSLSGKATAQKAPDLFNLAEDVLLRAGLDDEQRFKLMLLEEKARLEHGLIPAGHAAVSLRLKAQLNPLGWLEEQTNGIAYLNFIRALNERAESNWPSVLADLEELRALVLNKHTLIVNLTAEEEQKQRLLELSAALYAALPDQTLVPALRAMPQLPRQEALLTPAQVNYVGKAVNLFQHGYKYHGSALVIMKYLRTGRLWEQVRVIGGAYGAFCSLDRATGGLIMASYRDPNIAHTIKAFDDTAAYLTDSAPEQEALNAAIVGAIGDIDAYLLPEAKGEAAFTRALSGDTTELRQQLRDEVLSTTPKYIREFGEILSAALPKASLAVLGGSALEAEAQEQGWTINRVL